MGERRPLGEKEYSPLEDSLDLINKVLTNSVSEAESRAGVRLVEARDSGLAKDKDRSDEHGIKREASKPKNRPRQGQQEELMTFKFRISRSDYKQAKNIVAALERELDARIDLSNLGRGWITRLITAEKEIIDAARQQEKLKTPNSRNPLEVAEIDHTMTVVQSVAFRRAAPIR